MPTKPMDWKQYGEMIKIAWEASKDIANDIYGSIDEIHDGKGTSREKSNDEKERLIFFQEVLHALLRQCSFDTRYLLKEE